MKEDRSEGGDTITDLSFETKVDLLDLLRNIPSYNVKANPDNIGHDIYHRGTIVAQCFKKYDFYRFLEAKDIDWTEIVSQCLLPDDTLLVIVRKTLFIIEIEYQQDQSSADEELLTCDFKRKQYLRLVKSLGLKVEYISILSEWFKKPEYKDMLDYIHSMNCHYKFGKIPLSWLGLPTS